MARGIKILHGISKWVRQRVGPEAQNRGQDDASDETDEAEDEDNGTSSTNDSPVCCSAASNTDLTVLDP